MTQPTYTKSQKKIINYLYKFRYILIEQIQILLNHKNSFRIREWLTDLEKKRYIKILRDPKDKTKPYVICLAQKARYILGKDEDMDHNFLNRLYKEKSYSEDFIKRHLFIVETYLYFLRTKDNESSLSFFTQRDLKGYDYFPEDLPDAYIDLQEAHGNSRYFLDFFDNQAEPGNVRYRIRTYFEYYEEMKWQNNTDNAPFPAILMIFENKYRKTHGLYYAQALLKKSTADDIAIFMALKNSIQSPQADETAWINVKEEVRQENLLKVE
ncbi:hypothetical protein BH09PAT1_BH09PAT1_1690 [soil metagenome]